MRNFSYNHPPLVGLYGVFFEAVGLGFGLLPIFHLRGQGMFFVVSLTASCQKEDGNRNHRKHGY